MAAVLALLSSVLWGGADFLGGTLARRLAPLAVVGASQAIALLLIVPTALALGATGDPLGYLPYAVAAGLLGMASLVAFYSALAIGTMGVVAPIAATGAVVPVAIGLGQGERPAAVQLLGVVLAVAGVVLASGPEIRGAREGTAPGGARALGLALLSALGFGLVLWLIAKGAHYSVTMTLLTQRCASVSVVVVVAVAVRGTGGLARRDLPALAVVGAGDVVANGLYALATRTGLISLVAVLGSVYPVVTALLARFVHDERLRAVQVVGVVTTLAGVVMIAVGGA